jgi:proteasome lid subunit RPN8/RPN11
MIILKQDHVKKILQHARSEAPKESCGILVGEWGDVKIVKEVHLCTNVDAYPIARYTIDPKEILKIMDHANEKALEIVGFFHSHPSGGSYPSIIDSERASWSGASYIIISVPSGTISSWIWDERKGKFIEEELKVT